MTYNDLVKTLTSYGVEDSKHEALLILDHYFGATHSDTLMFPDREYDNSVIEPILARRARGEPIQYIIGNVFFFDCKFKVNRYCLIPRSDTEVLCEYLVSELPYAGNILELCTGSGCIPISVLKKRPDLTCTSFELIPETAELARGNQVLNEIPSDRLTIFTDDALKIVPERSLSKYDAIVSNPPYIRSDIIPTLSREVRSEPRVALDGGCDGMLFYRKFLSDYAPMLKPNGFFAFEIGFDQKNDIKKLCDRFEYSLKIIKDYSNNDRVAVIRPN